MFYQIFLSPQAKRCAIITYKHSIYELATMKPLLTLGENSCKTEIKLFLFPLFHMKTRVSLKYLVSYCGLSINNIS